MHSELQEPMLEATQSATRQAMGTDRPSPAAQAAQVRANESLRNLETGGTAPNSHALPNPWGAPTSPQPSSVPFASGNNASNPLSSLFGAGSGGMRGFNAQAGMGGQVGNLSALLQNPMVQQMMQQM